MSDNATKATNHSFSVMPFIFSVISVLLMLGSYLTYTIVPVSDLANGIDHSGMDAVYVLTLSPVFAVISLIMLAISFIISIGHLFKKSNIILDLIFYGTSAVMTVISIVFSIIFVVSQYDLGFTAPIDGTVYDSYSVFILINVIVEALLLVALALKMKGISFIKK